jgi:hypothetical protein
LFGRTPAVLPKLTPEAQKHFDAFAAATKEGKVYRDDIGQCWPAGMPIIMTRVWPIAMIQQPTAIYMVSGFMNSFRTIFLDGRTHTDPDIVVRTFNGESVGRWEGDTLVVDVTELAEQPWFDRAGNHHTDAMRMVERYTLTTPDIIQYEATIEDPNVFTRPWTIAMPIYRRVEPDMQVLHYRCTPFVEELLYGHLRKEPLVKRWEGETIVLDLTRPEIPADKSYGRIGR